MARPHPILEPRSGIRDLAAFQRARRDSSEVPALRCASAGMTGCDLSSEGPRSALRDLREARSECDDPLREAPALPSVGRDDSRVNRFLASLSQQKLGSRDRARSVPSSSVLQLTLGKRGLGVFTRPLHIGAWLRSGLAMRTPCPSSPLFEGERIMVRGAGADGQKNPASGGACGASGSAPGLDYSSISSCIRKVYSRARRLAVSSRLAAAEWPPSMFS
jgi:hypothetical protein